MECLLDNVLLHTVEPPGRADAELEDLGVAVRERRLDALDRVECVGDELDLWEHVANLSKGLRNLARELLVAECDLAVRQQPCSSMT